LPLNYRIDKERRLVVSTGSGILTYAEMKTHQDRLLADPNFNQEFNQLIDLTQVTGVDAATEEITALARRAVFSPNSKRAWVASSPGIFGIGRLAIAHHEDTASPSHASAFYDLPSALEWLGLSES
jgi:hypothetical protein